MDIPTRPAAVLSTPSPTNNWRSARMITDSSDVNTEGASILAWQASGSDYGGYPDQTVNGVAFQGKVTSANGISFTMSGLGGYDPTAFISTKTFTGPDAVAYGKMLAGARFGETEPIVLRFSGLTAGHTYLIQIWVADYREFLDVRTESIMGSGGGDINVPTLHYLTGDGFTPGSGRGEYVIGTFNAATSNATFHLKGNESSQINAFQLRDLTPAPPRISAALAGSNVTLSWPAAYAGWSLQVQTNMASPTVATNWMYVPGTGFESTNVITIHPANPPAFFRLREP
jgi:hypothetical protein